MNNKMKKVTMMMVVCLMAVLCFGNTAFGADEIKIPYEPGNKATFEVHQGFTVNNADKAPGDEFTYKITAKDAGNPMPSGGDTFTIKGNNAHSIEISFSEAGTYYYTLKQVNEGVDGYTYAAEEYTLEAHVRKTETNGLTVAPVIKNKEGNKPNPQICTFTCSYDGTGKCIATDPPVRKTVEGNPAEKETFEFVLKAQDLSNPMPAGSVNGEKTATVEGAGETEFGAWAYTEPGTYVYTVSEKDTGADDYVYDKNVYTITDTVTESDGKLTYSRVIKDSAGKEITGTIEFAFVNEYTGPKTTTPTTSTPTTSGGGNNGGGGGGKNGGGGIFGPKTGDLFNNKPLMAVLFGGAAVALAAIAWIITAKRRNREE